MTSKFSGLRTLNCFKISAYTDQSNYINDIEKLTSVEPSAKEDTKNNELSDENKEILYKIVRNKWLTPGEKIWRVIVTPGRKPRPRDYSNCVFEKAMSKEEVIQIVKIKLDLGDSVKLTDKNFVAFEVTPEELIDGPEFKHFMDSLPDEIEARLKSNDLKDLYDSIKNTDEEDIELEVPKNIKGMRFECEIKDGALISITPVPENFIQQLEANKFINYKVGPRVLEANKFINYKVGPRVKKALIPLTTVYADNPARAADIFCQMAKDLPENLRKIYCGFSDFLVYNEATDEQFTLRKKS